MCFPNVDTLFYNYPNYNGINSALWYQQKNAEQERM